MFVGLASTLAGPANGFCIYYGIDNPTTTIQEEFRDSRWVVRVRVLSAVDHMPDVGDGSTTYELAVVRAYKGLPGKRIKFFTERDSGGFYMDRPWVPLPQAHDIAGEYLLFLNPYPHYRGGPKVPTGATSVNYSCGQSKRWSRVSRPSRRLLEALAHRG